ncbi:DUF4269 domain-containing protein [Thermoflavimicrobium daqui]|uniref:DUF4269 domain-containing protein n=1 Tax=Thermoflavimicrobium daqui TaxID=2137476 RepID=A0A364K2C6_9BACL|nr:DUF4269 domain-containing protein [Thermoflavimicrobium daqui]RAL22572.1 DUF4269 domain-containing protein [Thermoflavimicrobium daqui]
MFNTIDYLQFGNEKQKLAYKAIRNLGIMDNLSEYNPTLCGTFPIGIDIVGSDLDMIMEVDDFHQFEEKVETLYGDKKDFKLKRLLIREVPVVKANFIFDGFEFELFGQSQPVKEQYAYLHMIIEYALMKQFPSLREEVIKLKKQGLKTEPAFCRVLGLEGDPYEKLLEFGEYMGII